MLKLLGRSSSINVRKVLWLAKELDLELEQEAYGRGFQRTDTAEFRALNPNALVPVLLDEDFVLWESNTICRYLAGREHRADLLPDTLRERAQVEKWMDWQATEVNSAWRAPFHGLVRKSPEYSDPALIMTGIDSWNRCMGIVEQQLAATGAFMTGDTFTLADIVIGLSTHRWLSVPMERPTLPAVNAYYKRLCAREGFQLYGRDGGV
jgi:glutathione S-transferase